MDKPAMDPARAPLFEAMRAHHLQKPSSFHVPGHKSGRGIDEEAAAWFRPMMSLDYTEISGLDDLHHAEGAILEAQELAADCFGAEETFFLVNGSTVGNLAMITSVCERGEIILVQRNVHKSVIHGIMLAGARAVFLPPVWDRISGIAAGIRIEDVRQGLLDYPEAKALIVTNPNYYGLGIELKPISELLHQHGKPLLVDEAHGAHYGFHEELPPSALSCGADAVVQSTHKMLTSMTMSAMLHVQGTLIDRPTLKQRLAMLQSSSPSYPLLASLDLARRQLHTEGRRFIEQGLRAAKRFRELLMGQEVFDFRAKSFPYSNETGYATADPFKISVYDATGTLSGPELRDELEAEGCFIEMADARQVLLVFTPASTDDDAVRVYEALCKISESKKLYLKAVQKAEPMRIAPYTEISRPIPFNLPFTPNSASGSDHEICSIPIGQASGRVSAEMVIPYPPGIPYLFPGEPITEGIANTLEELAIQGIRFQGTDFGYTRMLKVFKDMV